MFFQRSNLIIPLILMTLLLPGYLSGQPGHASRTILWTPVSQMRMDNQYQKVFHFQYANYELNTLLPKYYELLKIENNSEYTARIQNPVFQQADYELIKDIKNLDKIPSEIQVESLTSSRKKQRFLQISFVPLRRNAQSGRIELLTGFDLVLSPGAAIKKSNSASLSQPADRSVLASGKWVKIKVQADGIYVLSYDQLRQLGIDNPANVRVYGNGGGMLSQWNKDPRHDDLVENNILHSGDNIYFYGQSPHVWKYNEAEDFFNNHMHDYSDWTYYFLTSDMGAAGSIPDAPQVSAANYTSTSSDELIHHELEDINLIKSGREWYGEHFDIQTDQTFPYTVEGLDNNQDIILKVSCVGRASSTTSMQVSANGSILGSISMAGTSLSNYIAKYAYEGTGLYTFKSATDDINLNLRYIKNSPSAEAWLNYITLNARRNLDVSSGPLIFRDRLSVDTNRITEFVLSGASAQTQVWDITDPVRPLRMITSLQGNTLRFSTSTDKLKEFIAFIPGSGMLSPVTEGEDVGLVSNQDLHSLRAKNYIIVSAAEFISSARKLAAHRHDHDGLDTLVVTPEQIYNEFSSGSRDISAIRDFLKMLYDRAGSSDEMPKYVLLYGDGSYDNKGDGAGNTNFIPTYQSINSLSPTYSFVTDDFFGLLDEDEGGYKGLVDIGVGRFPVSSLEEASYVLEKTLSYDQNDKMGDWRNSICFIGDDEDYNTHMKQADQLAGYIESNYPDFSVGKIFLDAYNQVSIPSGHRYPDVNESINKRMEKGALIMNYTGHGGTKGLAHERIVNIEDILSWDNKDRLPLFMTATCEFSRFDEYESTSAGELVLLNPDGGGIALLTTTRLVYSAPNHALNEQFYQFAFRQDEQGRNYRLGDIIRLTKNGVSGDINKRNFTLLGDPAIELAYPAHRIHVGSINGTAVAESVDTLKALSKVTVEGYLEDIQGKPLNDFNGVLYPTIYDKATLIHTLQNDDNPKPPKMTFTLRNRILYKGKASVTNGKFSFSFIVPKDIAYNFDYGKLSFYADNGQEDASGSFLNAIIGGSADSVINDSEGPKLEVYMNDENFVYGGMTDDSPILLAYVSDSNGINTIGNGIGHDLTAILDGNTNSTIVLNDYYESDTDSYKSGKILYSFKGLEAGTHSLKVKVWDVHNNSSEETIEFWVNNEQDLVLDHVLNYPNPFTTYTQFFFEHNQPSADLDVLVQIFTISGKLVKTIDYHAPASGYRVGPIEWDGRDDYGGNIGRGVYIYRLKVRTSLGQIAEKYEKLVILN